MNHGHPYTDPHNGQLVWQYIADTSGERKCQSYKVLRDSSNCQSYRVGNYMHIHLYICDCN